MFRAKQRMHESTAMTHEWRASRGFHRVRGAPYAHEGATLLCQHHRRVVAGRPGRHNKGRAMWTAAKMATETAFMWGGSSAACSPRGLAAASAGRAGPTEKVWNMWAISLLSHAFLASGVVASSRRARAAAGALGASPLAAACDFGSARTWHLTLTCGECLVPPPSLLLSGALLGRIRPPSGGWPETRPLFPRPPPLPVAPRRHLPKGHARWASPASARPSPTLRCMSKLSRNSVHKPLRPHRTGVQEETDHKLAQFEKRTQTAVASRGAPSVVRAGHPREAAPVHQRFRSTAEVTVSGTNVPQTAAYAALHVGMCA